MQRIQSGRLDILIHGEATVEDLPVDGLTAEDLTIAGVESFTPSNMSEPKVYPGDVIVGVTDGEISFAELIYDKLDDAVLVVPLESGEVTYIADSVFTKRFYQEDEIHIYDDITRETPDWDTEFDESAVERPEISRAR
jgi:hypothetical protein